jgi:hypothetical protein
VTTDWAYRVPDPLLREDLQLCFAGDPQKRFAGIAQLAERLRQLPERRQEREAEQARLEARERAAYRRGVLRTAALALVAVGAFAGLALFALQKARQEMRQRAKVETQELSLQRNLYAADIQLAHQALAGDDFGRANQLLEQHRPAPGGRDLRGWEWHYLRQQCRADMAMPLPGAEFDCALAFSADGKRLLALHNPPAFHVYDLERRRVLWASKDTIYYCSAAFSPSGPWLALASPTHLEVRDTNTWAARRMWFSSPEQAADAIARQPGLQDRIGMWPGVRNPVRFSPDGRTLITDAAAGVCLWDTGDWRPVVALTNQNLIRAFEFWGDTISFSGSGEQVALATVAPDGRHLSVWNTADLRRPSPASKPLLRQAIPPKRF